MGAEALPATANPAAREAPLVLGLQASTLVDHVARVDRSLLDQLPGERRGSIPVEIEELEHILSEVKTQVISSPYDSLPMKTIAGGNVANTIRGLSAGFGVSCGIIGACGDDEQGQLFVSNMSSHAVNLSRLRMKKGRTAQCVCLVECDKNAIIRRAAIPARDLRILGPVFSHSSSILAREKAMVVNLEFIKRL